VSMLNHFVEYICVYIGIPMVAVLNSAFMLANEDLMTSSLF